MACLKGVLPNSSRRVIARPWVVCGALHPVLTRTTPPRVELCGISLTGWNIAR